MSLSSARSAVRGVFALQVVVAVLAFLLTLVITYLAITLFTHRASRHRSNRTSPKGTLAFLLLGILCLAIAQAATAASVALQTDTSSPISITHAFSLHYDTTNPNSSPSTTSTNLSFLNAVAFIPSTVALNGAVWLHSSHATSNGLAVGQPSWLSIALNTLLLTAMLGTGFASFGLAASSYTPASRYGTVLQDDRAARITYTVFRACVVGASISVSTEAIRRFKQVKNNSSRDVRCPHFMPSHPQTPKLTRFLPGRRAPDPDAPGAARGAPDPAAQRLHRRGHRAALGRRHVPDLERGCARGRGVPADYLRAVCGAVGVCDRRVGRVGDVEAGE